MTLQKDYFDRRVLSRPSAVSDGTDRLDDLRFREAEAEVRLLNYKQFVSNILQFV